MVYYPIGCYSLFPLFDCPKSGLRQRARQIQLLRCFFRASAQQSFPTGGLFPFIYSLSFRVQSSLFMVREYILLAAKGCGKLQALDSATQSLRLERL